MPLALCLDLRACPNDGTSGCQPADPGLATSELIVLLNLPPSINRRSATGKLSNLLLRHFAAHGTRVLVDRFGRRFWPAEQALELALLWRADIVRRLGTEGRP